MPISLAFFNMEAEAEVPSRSTASILIRSRLNRKTDGYTVVLSLFVENHRDNVAGRKRYFFFPKIEFR